MDTTLRECNVCGEETDCIQGVCEDCLGKSQGFNMEKDGTITAGKTPTPWEETAHAIMNADTIYDAEQILKTALDNQKQSLLDEVEKIEKEQESVPRDEANWNALEDIKKLINNL